MLKGINHPDDVRRAKDHGVEGIYCSNHGGRQADGGLPTLEALPEVDLAAHVRHALEQRLRRGPPAPG